jgi:hypothetical protein
MASAVSLRVDYSAAELQRLAAVLVDPAHPAPEDRKVALLGGNDDPTGRLAVCHELGSQA